MPDIPARNLIPGDVVVGLGLLVTVARRGLLVDVVTAGGVHATFRPDEAVTVVTSDDEQFDHACGACGQLIYPSDGPHDCDLDPKYEEET